MRTLVQHLEQSLRTSDPQWWFPAEKKLSTLSSLWVRARAMGGELAQRYGVRQQDKVVLILENSADYLCALLAVWQLGAVAVPVRPYGGKHFWFADYLAELSDITGFHAVIYDADNIALDVPALTTSLARPFIAVDALGLGSQVAPLVTDAAAHEHAIIQFTSGSTGQPKGVIVTHGMMMAQLEQLHENHVHARHGKGVERALSWLPFYHDMGMFIGVLLPLFEMAHGGAAPPAYYMRNPTRWFEHLSEWQADLSFTTNSVLASSVRHLNRLSSEKCNLHLLQLYVAAEKVNARVLRDGRRVLQALSMPAEQIHIGYGMAEYALGCTRSPHGFPNIVRVRREHDDQITFTTADGPEVLELVSVGVPNTGCRITIRDTHDDVLGEGRVGEIHVEGPCVSPGYYNNPEATAAKLAGGRLRTGDLGFVHEGELYFLSRMDDLLIIGGRNIVPGDVELLVEELDFIGHGRSVLFGVENPNNGTTEPVLLVESSIQVTAAELALREGLIRELVVNEIGLVLGTLAFVEKGTIEKTSSGKKRTRVIRQRYLQQEIERIQIHEEPIAVS